jgi:hypothetical protein
MVIPCRIAISPVDNLVDDLVIPGGITLPPVDSSSIE